MTAERSPQAARAMPAGSVLTKGACSCTEPDQRQAASPWRAPFASRSAASQFGTRCSEANGPNSSSCTIRLAGPAGRDNVGSDQLPPAGRPGPSAPHSSLPPSATASAMARTACRRSAFAVTIPALLPPISACSDTQRRAHRTTSSRPTASEPVKVTAATTACPATARAVATPPAVPAAPASGPRNCRTGSPRPACRQRSPPDCSMGLRCHSVLRMAHALWSATMHRTDHVLQNRTNHVLPT